MTLFKGAATALITPFKDGKIDYVSMGKLIEWQIAEGIDALVVCGTTGEASTLSPKEKIELTKFTVDLSAGRVPVIAGTGGNCTETALELSLKAEETGADGLLIITPYYNKCTQKGLYFPAGIPQDVDQIAHGGQRGREAPANPVEVLQALLS